MQTVVHRESGKKYALKVSRNTPRHSLCVALGLTRVGSRAGRENWGKFTAAVVW